MPSKFPDPPDVRPWWYVTREPVRVLQVANGDSIFREYVTSEESPVSLGMSRRELQCHVCHSGFCYGVDKEIPRACPYCRVELVEMTKSLPVVSQSVERVRSGRG